MSENLWRKLKGNTSDYPVDWNRMYDNIRKSKFPVGTGNPPAKRSFSMRLLVSAIVFLFLGTGAWLQFFTSPQPSAAPVLVSAKTPEKDVQTIHLADGSTAVLFGNSTLDYPAAFTGNTREVSLSGHGYFDIRPNPAQPFIVHTGKISTRVLGTTFYIKAYPQDETIEVKVKTGKVQVLSNNKPLGMLAASELISFSKKTNDFLQHAAPLKPATTNPEVHFDNLTLEAAAMQLNDWFLTDIIFVNNNIKNCRVTATFSSEDSLEEMLTVICGVLKTSYKITDGKVMIDGQGCIN